MRDSLQSSEERLIGTSPLSQCSCGPHLGVHSYGSLCKAVVTGRVNRELKSYSAVLVSILGTLLLAILRGEDEGEERGSSGRREAKHKWRQKQKERKEGEPRREWRGGGDVERGKKKKKKERPNRTTRTILTATWGSMPHGAHGTELSGTTLCATPLMSQGICRVSITMVCVWSPQPTHILPRPYFVHSDTRKGRGFALAGCCLSCCWVGRVWVSRVWVGRL